MDTNEGDKMYPKKVETETESLASYQLHYINSFLTTSLSFLVMETLTTFEGSFQVSHGYKHEEKFNIFFFLLTTTIARFSESGTGVVRVPNR